MAKYIGLMSSDARGKVGGIVLTRGRNGTNLKAKGIPINPNSRGQNASRALMIAALQAWQTLGFTDQQSWLGLGAAITYYNSLAQPYNPSGQQLFVSTAIQNYLYPLNTMGTAPSTPPVIPNVYFVELVMSGPDLTVSVFDAAMVPIVNYNLYLSRAVSQGMTYPPRNLAKYMGSSGGLGVADWSANYLNAFGYGPQTGFNVVCEVMPFDPASSITGNRVRSILTIA